MVVEAVALLPGEDADAVTPSQNFAALDAPRRPIPASDPGAVRFPIKPFLRLSEK
jgi:hypothetical protein